MFDSSVDTVSRNGHRYLLLGPNTHLSGLEHDPDCPHIKCDK